MASNRCGKIFSYTSWGESHGKAVGVLIDGSPPLIELSEELLQKELDKRRPGNNPYVSQRKERDRCQILSGVFKGKTTGAPIMVLIWNEDHDSSCYDELEEVYRPGHANFTYLEKYGIFDHRGGGRASARETVARVCAGALAKQILKEFEIDVCGYVEQIHEFKASTQQQTFFDIKKNKEKSLLFYPDKEKELFVKKYLERLISEGDSCGACIKIITTALPIGLGDPVYEKLEATLGKALLSIPATKGVFFGSIDGCLFEKGSDYQDTFVMLDQKPALKTNRCGGTLGGISCGTPLEISLYFKPTSSIKKAIQTVNFNHETISLKIDENSRHDPCVGIRGSFIAEHMVAITLVDALLMKKAHAPLC